MCKNCHLNEADVCGNFILCTVCTMDIYTRKTNFGKIKCKNFPICGLSHHTNRLNNGHGKLNYAIKKDGTLIVYNTCYSCFASKTDHDNEYKDEPIVIDKLLTKQKTRLSNDVFKLFQEKNKLLEDIKMLKHERSIISGDIYNLYYHNIEMSSPSISDIDQFLHDCRYHS